MTYLLNIIKIRDILIKKEHLIHFFIYIRYLHDKELWKLRLDIKNKD